MDRTVIVVGAGVIGSSVAFHLAKAGYAVTVVDRAGGPGHGSTSASSAVIRFDYSTFDGVLTAWESAGRWAAWPDYLGLAAELPLARFHKCGMAFLDADVVPRERITGFYREIGIPFERLEGARLSERVPGIDRGRYWPPKPVTSDEFFAESATELGATYTPDAGFVDDPQFAAANLAEAARAHGATLLFKARIVGIEQTEAGWTVALADGRRLTAEVVVNAAGPWSTIVNTMAGIGDDFTVSLRPLRQEVHYVPAPPGYSDGERLGPDVADLDLGTYLRPDTRGGLLVGGTEPECDRLDWLDDPDDADLNRTAERFEAQVLRAARRFPDLAVPSQPKGVVGVYDVSSDWAPIYDKTDREGFYVAIGTSGNQFKNAPLAGEFLAALVEATDSGHDHDRDPVRYRGVRSGREINLGAFSRRRAPTASSGTVMG